MIGFVTWPHFTEQSLWQKRWPSDKANHSCDDNLLTIVLIESLNNAGFSKLVF